MATTLEQNTLEAQAREAGTKNHARRVRREGKIPAVVYGAGKDSLPVTVDPRHVLRILRSDSGHNTIFDLALHGGEKTKAMQREIENRIMPARSEEHTSELQSLTNLVCRLLLEKKKKKQKQHALKNIPRYRIVKQTARAQVTESGTGDISERVHSRSSVPPCRSESHCRYSVSAL